MLKKITVACAILAASSSIAFAAAAPYVGVDLGGVSYNSNTDAGRFGATALTGGLYAGYGATVQGNLYLGGEVFASMSNASQNVQGDNSDIKQKLGYGVDFIPGIMLNDKTMAYAKLGLERSKFESSDESATLNGYQAGLGLQTSLTSNVDVRGEYVYNNFKKKDDADGKLTTGQYTVGLSYNFA